MLVPRLAIIVPVYNEGKVFYDWFPKLLTVAQSISASVIVIDDGSEEAIRLAEHGVHILRHELNCGVGAALETGFEYARRNGFGTVLTIDGDGQHDPEDLPLLLAVLLQGPAQIVNGSRFLKSQPIPLLRRWANLVGNVTNLLLTGKWITDSQSGMKAFGPVALREMKTLSPGYEWCLDVFRIALWTGMRVVEIPISVRYTPHSIAKGQGFAVGIDMLMRLSIHALVKGS